MTKALSHHKSSFFARLFGSFGDGPRLRQEKARLEAFLTAFPGEYCGWSRDGSVAYSQGFADILSIGEIANMGDIQNALSPSDAAALEGFFDRLENDGVPFVMTAQNDAEDKTYKISGSQGHDLDKQDFYDVLWIEDITSQVTASEDYQQELSDQTAELKKFKTLLNAMPRPLWLRDENQKIVWCNTTYAEFLNQDLEDILAEQKEIFGQLRKTKQKDPDETPPGKELAARALKEGQKVQSYVHGVIKGSRMLLRISEIPLPDYNMTLGVAYDVTREEELENQLGRYQSSNQELLEQLRTAIGIFDTDQRLEFYNNAFEQLWDLEGQWLNTKPKLGDIMEKLRETRRLPEQADFRRYKQTWLDMFTGLIEPHDDMLYLPDGTALRMLVVPHSFGGLMMTFEDVTSRLELESSYNTLIAVQKETLDNLAEGVAVYGGDGRIKLWNPAFSRLWGLNPEDLEGSPHITNIVEKKHGYFLPEEWEFRKEELIAHGLDRLMHEGRLERTDNNLVDFITVPLPDGGVLVTYTDVTDTVQVENALREKAAALEAAERLKLDFLANVSYQLRTPLNAIMGFNDILGQGTFGALNEKQVEYTGYIAEASERLLGLINDILDLSTLEAGYMTLQREEVSIYGMLKSVEDLVGDWARKEDISVTLKCAKNIGQISVDERRVQQAIINVIRNAINFTPSGGKITLAAKRENDGVNVSISDTGIGIAKEDRQRIFEPFERAQSTNKDMRSGRGGAGLGLSLVKNIVELHGGKISIESEPDEGTTVQMYLPMLYVPTNLKLPIGQTVV